MDRTLVLPLHPTPEQAKGLKEPLEQHTACFKAVARLGWITEQHNGVELHKQTSYELRALSPDLPAHLVCAARLKATEAVKSALTWRKKRAEA
jgi:putative transposase